MQDPCALVGIKEQYIKKPEILVSDPNEKWKVLSAVTFGIFMVILDTTVVNVAFQTIRDAFGGNINDAQWVISIYVLALGITTPLAGFLADRFGTKRIYLGGLALFATGSLVCGLSNSLGLLIAARALQGVGGGLALPLGTALLLQAFPPSEQGTALGVFGLAALVAPAIGPILGGWLVDQNLWRVIFFINPPIGLVGVVLGIFLLPRRDRPERLAFDVGGMITEVIGFGAVLYAASIAADQGWTSPSVLLWFAVGVVGLLLFGVVELRFARNPLLNLRLFREREFTTASLLGYVSTVALFGAEFLLPVYLQALRGESALQTGFILLPMALSGGIFVILSGWIYDRVGPRPLMAVGFAVLIVNTWQLSKLNAGTPISWILFLLVLRGMALGLTVQTTQVAALAVVPRSDLARGSSLTSATRLVVQSIGVAVLATVLVSTITPDITAIQNQVNQQVRPDPAHPIGICQPPGQLNLPVPVTGGNPAQIQSALQRACQENISGFEQAYTVTFYAAIVALALGLLLPGWPGRWAGREGMGGNGDRALPSRVPRAGSRNPARPAANGSQVQLHD